MADQVTICFADSAMGRLMQYLSFDKEMDPWHLHITEIFSGLCGQISIPSLAQIDDQARVSS